jgi:MtN3 and saliva related transmembrane protein
MTALIGLVACSLTTTAWLPQLWRTWRTRSAGDLSWGYLAVTATGMGTWLTYGALVADFAVVVTNVLTLSLVAALVVLKVHSSIALPDAG